MDLCHLCREQRGQQPPAQNRGEMEHENCKAGQDRSFFAVVCSMPPHDQTGHRRNKARTRGARDSLRAVSTRVAIQAPMEWPQSTTRSHSPAGLPSQGGDAAMHPWPSGTHLLSGFTRNHNWRFFKKKCYFFILILKKLGGKKTTKKGGEGFQLLGGVCRQV